MASFRSRYRAATDGEFRLKDHRTDDDSCFDGDKDDGLIRLEELRGELSALQARLYAEGEQRVLLVLQAMDAAGKDSTVRDVLRSTNPMGVHAYAFGRPSSEELAHDYLWRIHEHTPGTGEIAIFNRSHYEDVLVVRVHDIVPEERWRKRYDHINAFEKLLADEGTTIIKIFLHISKDEQKERFQSRLDRPHKQWKFRKGDLDDRALWDEFQQAYEAMLS